ncbi:MAG: DUF58 domain-containing protein [Actinomycetota bacterium]|nr:DUF58 domain-containing protein [Actinomycetota bacterium]
MSAGRYAGALRGLTGRGRAFLASGIACVAVAVAVGQRDLLRVGLLLATVPLASVWVVVRTRYRLACSRQLHPERVPAGTTTTVVLRLDNVSRLPTGLLLVEDRVPYALGARPRFVLDRVEPRGSRSVSYTLRSDVRGRFPLGPLAIRLTDPFGMCELTRSFSAVDRLTVTPPITDLPRVALGGERSGSGQSHARSVAAAGDDDVGTREYRHGDALHRVHWRTTARYGELMVRREEQPWESRATVLLDARMVAHRGEGPDSSFELAVAIAASVGVHLARGGYAVRLLSDDDARSDGLAVAHRTGADVEGCLLDTLAVISPSASRAGLQEVLPQLRRGSGEGLTVAVLAALEPGEAQAVAAAARGCATAVAVLVDSSAWGTVSARHREQEAEALRRTEALLTANGWHVVRAGPDADLAQLWTSAARRGGDGVPLRRGASEDNGATGPGRSGPGMSGTPTSVPVRPASVTSASVTAASVTSATRRGGTP